MLAMSNPRIGSPIHEFGTLLHENGDFVLRRDLGGRWLLDMHSVSVDRILQRVCISGVVVADQLVAVNDVVAA